MEAGRLRERVRIETATPVSDGAGGQLESWSALPQDEAVPAEVIATGAREAMRSGALTQLTSYAVTLRRRRLPVTADQRLVWRGESLAIRSVTFDVRRRVLVLICESGVFA